MKYLHFVLCYLVFLANSQSNDKLIFVMTHFRHGARSPAIIKNNMDDIGEEWLNPGELTAIGERMHYLLGFRNRLRYINEKKLLSEKFNSSELEVFTTNVGRTIASLSSHLQGLYPQSEKLGKYITDNQLKTSDPPVELSHSRIIQEKNELKDSALPNYMTLVPFKTIEVVGNTVEYFQELLSDPNNCNFSSVKSLENEINENYKIYLDQLNEKNNSSNYSIYDASVICDSYVPNYVDGRNMSKLKKTGINFEEFYDFCLRVLNETFGHIIPQNNKTRSYIQGTKYMELLVNYSKLRIDEDIKNSASNNSVSSSKKMLILSGHDSTISQQELFILNSLGENLELYRFPTFAGQIAFEITRKDDNKEKRNYSDYFVNYYFNDELLLNMTLSEFYNKVEPNIQSKEIIDEYYNSNGNTEKNNTNGDVNNNENNDENVVVIKKNNYRNAPLIVFACLFGVSLILNAFLLYKLLSKKTDKRVPTQSFSDMKA